MVSGVLLIEAADNRRPVHKLRHQAKQDHPGEFLPSVSASAFGFGLLGGKARVFTLPASIT
jgi:hypothetical protein